MNLLLLIESIRFHRVKQEGAVRLLFIFCYLINIASYYLPGSDPDMSGLTPFLDAMAEYRFVAPTFTRGNLVFMALTVAASMVTLMVVYLYAAIFAGEREGVTASQAVLGLLRALPALLLCGFLLVIPTFLSFFLLMVPILIIVTTVYFLPLNLILGRMGLTDAIVSSARDTKRMKFFILLQLLMLMIVMNLPENILFAILQPGDQAAVLVGGFFIAMRALMRGRLMGLLYLNLVKKVPIVIPSKPNA